MTLYHHQYKKHINGGNKDDRILTYSFKIYNLQQAYIHDKILLNPINLFIDNLLKVMDYGKWPYASYHLQQTLCTKSNIYSDVGDPQHRLIK